MIDKRIHYCWFGGKDLPNEAKECLNSWRKYCSDYEIIEWNETNIDLTENDYIREAYEEKKWAFITDYVRLKVLYENGGIYMDTDVEVLKPLDEFLMHEAFSGFEDIDCVHTGIMACEKGNPVIKELLDYYKDKHFIMPDGTYDMTTNVVTITKYFKNKGLLMNNTFQCIDGFCFYPKDYFCPKNHVTGKIVCTNNTYTIHHFSGSWHTPYQKMKAKFKKIIGSRLTEKILILKHKLFK